MPAGVLRERMDHVVRAQREGGRGERRRDGRVDGERRARAAGDLRERLHVGELRVELGVSA